MRQSAWLLYSIHLGSPLTVLVTAIHVAKWCSDSQAKSMSQAVAAAVRSGDRMRAERLLGDLKIQTSRGYHAFQLSTLVDLVRLVDPLGAMACNGLQWLEHGNCMKLCETVNSQRLSSRKCRKDIEGHFLGSFAGSTEVIHACAKTGDMAGARRWLRQMRFLAPFSVWGPVQSGIQFES